jgi:hypothetical protein
MAHLARVIVSLLAFLSLLSTGVLTNAIAQEPPDQPVVLLAEVKAGKLVYQIDGRRTSGPDLLHALDLVAEHRGKNVKVIVLLDHHATFLDYGNVEGILGKAQLTQIHFYIFDKQSNQMGSLQFGKTTPFTTSPSWE